MRLKIEYELDEIFESGNVSTHIQLITVDSIDELAIIIQITRKNEEEEIHYHAFSDTHEAIEWLNEHGFDIYDTLS